MIGAGAAGSMASIVSARNGNETLVFEKNDKTGKKIYITGKGRCNVTNLTSNEELIKNTVANKKFMYSSFDRFSSEDTIRFFENLGCKLKVERGNRVFPQSDKSSDIIKALNKGLKDAGVELHYNEPVKGIIVENGSAVGIRLKNREISADKVILATGGLSYRSTGSTGDGYEFAKELGHTIVSCRPSLVGINLVGDISSRLTGLSLRNVRLKFFNDKKKVIFDEFGELLFTKFGISGPLVLSASSLIGDEISNSTISIDLKPALSIDELDKRLIKDFTENKKKSIKNSFDALLPKSLIPVFVDRLMLNKDKRAEELTKKERERIIFELKNFCLEPLGLRGYEEAVVTRGGVSTKEINPRTMESKIVRNLYFAGEIMDVDALTGGFNLQIAWSTGFVAGSLHE